MSELLSNWWNTVPEGAYFLLGGLVVFTVMLVRSSMHPTVFALVAWPGTLAHELAHVLVGLLLGAKPCEFSLFPKNMGNGRWQLGSVGFSNMTWWNGPWTAMAPMLLAPLAILLTVEWAYPALAGGDLGGALVRLLLCALFMQAAWPSSTDFRVAAPGLFILGLIGVVLY